MKAKRSYRYRVVDVFTERPLEGNALAVFPDAGDIDDETMQKIAREFNLAETTFVRPASLPHCALALRIFTPTREVPFAGHPTIGTSFVLLDEDRVCADGDRFVLEERVGLVKVRVERGARPLIWLTTPPIVFGPTYDPAVCARAVGLDRSDLLDIAPQLVSAGVPAIFIALRDQGAVDRARVGVDDVAMLKTSETDSFLVFVFAPTPAGAYSRMFAPEFGIIEDPATGGATGPLAAFMMRHDLVSGVAGTRFVSEQGTKMGRSSILHVAVAGESGADGIEVGGYVTPLAEGTMTF
jgi:trans-2,3-dihydro-3-hydroxyanthranilate isomerase